MKVLLKDAPSGSVQTKSGTSVGVDFNQRRVVESCHFKSQSLTTCASTNLYRAEFPLRRQHRSLDWQTPKGFQVIAVQFSLREFCQHQIVGGYEELPWLVPAPSRDGGPRTRLESRRIRWFDGSSAIPAGKAWASSREFFSWRSSVSVVWPY